MSKKEITVRIIGLVIVIILGIVGIWYYGSRSEAPSVPAVTPGPSSSSTPSPSAPTSTVAATTTSPRITITPGTGVVPAPVIKITLGKAYEDPKGAFSFQYPAGLTVTTTANIYNGNSLGVSDHIANELVEAEAGPAPSMSLAIASTGVSLAWMNIATGPSVTQGACLAPGVGTQSGTSTAVTLNGTQWYEGSQWFQQGNTVSVDDEYQAYHVGTCWGIEFQWMEASSKFAAGDPINALEASILKTFRF